MNKLKLYKKLTALLLTGSTFVVSMQGCSSEVKENISIEVSHDETSIEKEEKKVIEIIYKNDYDLDYYADKYDTTKYEIVKSNNIHNTHLIGLGQKLYITPGDNYVESFGTWIENRFEHKLSMNGYVKGINLTVEQSGIDLKKVLRNNDIGFVMIESNDFWNRTKENELEYNYGNTYNDEFYNYANTLSENSVPFGVYFSPTLTDITTTKQEINIVCNLLEGLSSQGIKCDMPICIKITDEIIYDLASRIKSGHKTTMSLFRYMVQAFQARGYCIMLNSNTDILKKDELAVIAGHNNIDLWLIDDNEKSQNISDDPTESFANNSLFTIKQYTKGKVEGYDGLIDISITTKNYPKIIRMSELNEAESYPVIESANNIK